LLELDIHKTFKSKTRNVELSCKAHAKAGEITALFGKSGVGKTTVLRMIAGLERPDGGTITFNDKPWYTTPSEVPLKDRPVGFVFQDFNLFRNMTVKQNLEYAAGGGVPQKVLELIEELAVTSLLASFPYELSKGQQQKIAILRSICIPNEVLLLDEPFSALDDESILEIINVLEKLKADFGLTIILVTHRKDVILRTADSVVEMEDTKSRQGEPKELIHLAF
jgi:molybdate transport system ATP-binding protein